LSRMYLTKAWTSRRLNEAALTYMKSPREIGYVRAWTVAALGLTQPFPLSTATMVILSWFSRAYDSPK